MTPRLILLLPLLLFSACIGAERVEAQRNIERGLVFNPLLEQPRALDDGEVGLMHHVGGWGSFSRYAAIRDEDHLWLHQLGGFIELARFGTSGSLLLLSHIEFVADPHNDINFNPRSIFWSEGLLYTHRLDAADLQIGYYHRCKHDIDNLRLGEERTLIYGSITGRAILSRPNATFALKTDLYTIREDHRLPPETRGVGLELGSLLGTVEGVARFEHPLGPDGLRAYVSGYLSFTAVSETDDFFGRFGRINDLRPSGGVSAGLAIRGAAGEMRLGATYEYLHDTGIRPLPRGAHLLRFGIEIVDPFSIR